MLPEHAPLLNCAFIGDRSTRRFDPLPFCAVFSLFGASKRAHCDT
jgi:hypothetical protein